MQNIPDKIYLQIGEDIRQADNIDFNELVGISWSNERINFNDIVYTIQDADVLKQEKKPKLYQCPYNKAVKCALTAQCYGCPDFDKFHFQKNKQ